MKKSYRKYLPFLAAAILATGCAQADGEKKTGNNSVQETGKTLASESETAAAPVTFEAQDMEGNTVSSSVLAESKLTMVNVWATYCNPCLREMPGLGELAQAYEPETFQIIGVISDVQEGADQETMDLAAGLIEQTGANYTHLLLNESLYYGLLTDVTAVPTTFFIDENGTVLETVVGSMEKSAWEEKINAHLEE